MTRIGTALGTERETKKLLGLILDQARRITKSDAGSLYLVETDEDTGIKRMRFMVAQTPVGAAVPMKVLRQGREQALSVKIGEQPKDMAQAGGGRRFDRGGKEPRGYSNAFKGMGVDNITPDLARQFGLSGRAEGAIVTSVEPGSPAAAAGVQPGDIITEVNHRRVTNVDDLERVARNTKASDSVLLRVRRDGASSYIVLAPAE